MNLKFENKDTPIVSQYKEIKNSHMDKLLFFHLGDFFEMFYEDAEIVAKKLGLTLTYRKNGNEKIYMCGIPVANKDFYIEKLVNQGFKIAICEQTETPIEAKKRGSNLVNRNVTAVYTAGTYANTSNSENNYILSIDFSSDYIFCFYLDIITEDFFFEKIFISELENIICRINPKEILLLEDLCFKYKNLLIKYEDIITYISFQKMQINFCEEINTYLLNGENEKINSLKILYSYIYSTYNVPPKKIPTNGLNSREMILDEATIKNLDLFNEKSSLFTILNKTSTPMGKRKLKQMILKPLTKIDDILKRLENVQYFYSNFLLKNSIYKIISSSLLQIGDIPKMLFLLKKGKINASLIKNFLISLEKSEEIINFLKNESILPILLNPLIHSYENMKNYKKLLEVFEDSPDFFKSDFLNKIYDRYEISQILMKIQNHFDAIKIYIPSVKISNNNIIGYFFEINQKDKSFLENCPMGTIIKQSLLHAIRFTTKELIELESNLIFLEEKRLEIRTLFIRDFISQIFQEQKQIEDMIYIISQIDVFNSLGIVANENNFYKPLLVEEKNTLEIFQMRHPVLEKRTLNFIKNNLYMSKKKITFITGPNMGGKSTFMRTAALNVLMAQMGSFVAADKLIFHPFNQIYVYIGCQDDPLKGESTFFKEMKECSKVLNHCENLNTFVFFDELCRGTSYEEGIILTEEIIKYLLEKKISVIISSHYLELAKTLEKIYKDFINILYTKYTYEDNNLIFLYEMITGISDCSFGIKVAEMAGIPKQIIVSAEEKYKKLK